MTTRKPENTHTPDEVRCCGQHLQSRCMTREEILNYAKRKFGKCNYQERIEPAPHTYGKRFIRNYKAKDWTTVARLYSYESTGTVYFKDFINKKSFQWN